MKLPLTQGADKVTASWPATGTGLQRSFRTTGEGRRLSINMLAALTGISRSQIKRIQGGEIQMVTLEHGMALSRALGKSPWWILEYLRRAVAVRGKRQGSVSRGRAKARARKAWL